MFEQIFSLIAPHLCIGCGKEGALLCAACAATVPQAPLRCYRCAARCGPRRICSSCQTLTPLDAVRVVAPYTKQARTLVRRLKYERAAAAADTIAQLMSGRLVLGETPTIVTCAPTATRRVRIRGYDQSVRIGRRLARIWALPYRPLLFRIGQTRQVGASREQRQMQMSHAFTAQNLRLIQNAHIVLVDDVLTTGATLEAASSELKRAGAAKVTAVVFAAA